jgi:hypothetical protein
VDLAVRSILQGAIPFVMPPSSYMQNNGVVILGQRPASSATVTFSATSGSVTATFSAATLGGTPALDTGRVLTVLDTTYKFFTVTGNSGSSTTVCQGTISGGTLSTVGAFANSAIWLSNNPTNGVAGYGTPLRRVVGNCFAQFPAGAISTGSAAGWYWTNWSSTTVGQIYNNGYSSGTPSVVASPTTFVTTGPGAFTQFASGTTFIQGPKATVAGNSFGLNGAIETAWFASGSGSSGTKLFSSFFGTAQVGQDNLNTAYVGGAMNSVSNQGATGSQINMRAGGLMGGDYNTASAANPVYDATVSAIDTTAAQPAGIQFANASAFDWSILERYSMKLYPTSP